MLKTRAIVTAVVTALGFSAAALVLGWAAGSGHLGDGMFGPSLGFTDTVVYFAESDWVLSSGHLPFRDTFSEYPLAANLLFGLVRRLSVTFTILAYPLSNFSMIWMGFAGLVYGYGVARVAREGPLQLAAWLSAGVVYFTLYRYDIFPALAFMLALWALREEAWVRAAIWLGVCIALKGYAVVALPALAVFMTPRLGLRRALTLCAAALAPTLAGVGVVWLYADPQASLMPYLFQAGRPFNREAIYLVVDRIVPGNAGGLLNWLAGARVPLLIQAGFALAAAATRPRTYQELVQALVVAVVGFVTFGAFHSPQFVLWIIAVTTFSRDRTTLVLAALLGWLTAVFFPVLYYLDHLQAPPAHSRGMLEASIVVLVVLKLSLLLGALPARDRKAETGAAIAT